MVGSLKRPKVVSLMTPTTQRWTSAEVPPPSVTFADCTTPDELMTNCVCTVTEPVGFAIIPPQREKRPLMALRTLAAESLSGSESSLVVSAVVVVPFSPWLSLLRRSLTLLVLLGLVAGSLGAATTSTLGLSSVGVVVLGLSSVGVVVLGLSVPAFGLSVGFASTLATSAGLTSVGCASAGFASPGCASAGLTSVGCASAGFASVGWTSAGFASAGI